MAQKVRAAWHWLIACARERHSLCGVEDHGGDKSCAQKASAAHKSSEGQNTGSAWDLRHSLQGLHDGQSKPLPKVPPGRISTVFRRHSESVKTREEMSEINWNTDAAASSRQSKRLLGSAADPSERPSRPFYRRSTSKHSRFRVMSVPGDTEDPYAVLPLNRAFSTSMKAAIGARRTLEDECVTIRDKQLAARQLHWDVQDKIDECRSLKDRLQALVQDSSYGDKCLAPLRAVIEQLGKLYELLQKVDQEQQILAAAAMRQVAKSLRAQREANRFIEAAFVHNEALPPWQAKPGLPPTPRDVDEEIRKLDTVPGRILRESINYPDLTSKSLGVAASACPGKHSAHSRSASSWQWPKDTEVPRRPDETTRVTAVLTADGHETDSNQPSPNLSTQEALRSAYFTAKDVLRNARERYEARESNRKREIELNNGFIEESEGVGGIPWEVFDVLWLRLIFKLTRELIDAEEAVRDARIAAIRAGCKLSDHDATSIFDNGHGEGYSPSWEEASKETAPAPLIEAWISEHARPYEVIREKVVVDAPDIDSWEGAEPEPWESWSASAYPKAKVKIIRWQQACGSRA